MRPMTKLVGAILQRGTLHHMCQQSLPAVGPCFSCRVRPVPVAGPRKIICEGPCANPCGSRPWGTSCTAAHDGCIYLQDPGDSPSPIHLKASVTFMGWQPSHVRYTTFA